MSNIPRIFHRVWLDIGRGPDVPQRYLDQAAQWTDRHPNWSSIVWNFERCRSFLQKTYPSYLPIWLSYANPMYRVDAIRYFILHHFGGVYLDFDVRCKGSLDKLFAPDAATDSLSARQRAPRHQAFLVPLGSMINNYFMAFSPGHPFLDFVTNLMQSKPSKMAKIERSVLGLMYVAGPFFLTKCYRKYTRGCRRRGQNPSSCDVTVTTAFECVRNNKASKLTALTTLLQHSELSGSALASLFAGSSSSTSSWATTSAADNFRSSISAAVRPTDSDEETWTAKSDDRASTVQANQEDGSKSIASPSGKVGSHDSDVTWLTRHPDHLILDVVRVVGFVLLAAMAVYIGWRLFSPNKGKEDYKRDQKSKPGSKVKPSSTEISDGSGFADDVPLVRRRRNNS